MAISKNSLGLTALAATSTVGAWLIWKAMRPSNRAATSTHPSKRSPKKDGLFGSLFGDSSHDDCYQEERTVMDVSARSDSSSTLGDDELEPAWSDSGEVDLRVFKQLIQQKQERMRRPPRSHSKLSLFSHLVSRLEHTLDEQYRIEEKLNHFRHLHDDDKVENATTAPTISTISSTSTDSNIPSPVSIKPDSSTSVCMVVQRYRGATLLINEKEVVRVGANTSRDLVESRSTSGAPTDTFCGLLVYVSFAKGCTQQMVQAASKIIVNLPVLTMGAWGDGASENMNVIDLAKKHPSAASIMIVPQANLINKVKSQGKSIQYHGQIDKAEGNTMYHYFVNCVRGLVLEQQCQVRQEALPDWYKNSCSAQSGSSPQASPSIPPEDLFCDPSLYTSWDDNGIPLTDAEDEPITKSAQKKLRKAQAAHRVRHLKYLRDASRQGRKVEIHPSKASAQQEQEHQHIEHWATAIDPAFVNVVAGTFGKRQSLEFVADMGPFCHVIQV